jgi:two-component system, chemotaxis family, chemotaxis protein CheY
MLRVVIIDGNAISRGLLNTVLTDGGHEVVGDSNTALAGVTRMISLQPQLVCVDVAYADDGWALLDSIRDALPKAIICMVSGKFEPATIEEAVKHGVHGFIVKPFKAATVLATIRNAIIKVVTRQQKKQAEQDGDDPLEREIGNPEASDAPDAGAK